MKTDALKIINARENNLKNISLELAHDSFTVLTGLSGSGKSSLAYRTVYAEGQRRYIETFSPYTRQFFDKVKKPDVDLIENVRPAIAIQQKTRVTNSRSTVGSITNVNDYLKILWSNIAEAYCPNCKVKIKSWSAAELAKTLIDLLAKDLTQSLLVCCRTTVNKKYFKLEIERLKTLGFSRFYNSKNNSIELFEDVAKPALFNEKLIVVLDRLRPDPTSGALNQKRLTDSIDQAFALGSGSCLILNSRITENKNPESALMAATTAECGQKLNPLSELAVEFSNSFSCKVGATKIEKLKPALFSYNHPLGACTGCKGFGNILVVNPDLVIPNPLLSLASGAINCWAVRSSQREYRKLAKFCESRKISLTESWQSLSTEQKDLIFNSKSRDFTGVVPWFKKLERKIYKMHVRVFLSRYRSQVTCPDCNGARLKPSALAYRFDQKTLPQIWEMPLDALAAWLTSIAEKLKAQAIFPRQLEEVFNSVHSRILSLLNLGLPYLSLSRAARTLSGGETQRVNLAAALGSELISTHFVLDEPSVGLHPRDTAKLITSLKNLQQRGNSLLVVEHDLDCLKASDNIVELGPKAGEAGGAVVYSGSTENWSGIALKLPRLAPLPASTKKDPVIEIKNASARNLKNINLQLPLGNFICLTGVSGSGKSTLVKEVIKETYDKFKIGLQTNSEENLVYGFEAIDQLLLVDQSGLARSPRANIATYSKIWEQIRNLLAQTEEAKSRGLSKSSFSFNVAGGRCPACEGAGFIREDMQFLSDVYISCELCLGKRFQQSVLEVQHAGYNAHDFLSMTVEKCTEVFATLPQIQSAAKTLCLLGLGHLTLGHPLSSLSGGEAQRLKLVPFVEQSAKGKSLLIFDEPTTGLHVHDVERLISLFRLLQQRGHTVLCVEHNLQLIAAADWIIDLGPEGGAGGGEILIQGSPWDLIEQAEQSGSYTAKYLKTFFKKTAANKKISSEVIKPETQFLQLRGAREHNLKNINLDLPLNQFVALTGLSGSGKSTIAKDIIYAEGQRRYLDCLSPYARQYIKELKRPEIDQLTNIKPTICVYQHTFQPSKLSTIATMSEIYNFLRLLYAKIGVQFCPDHPQQMISPLSPTEIAEQVLGFKGEVVRILAPIIKSKKGLHKTVFERARQAEINEVRVDGVFAKPAQFEAGLEKNKAHSIEFTIVKAKPENLDRELLADAVAQALSLGGGILILLCGNKETIFSTERTCSICKTGFFKPDPEDLSFNSKRGICPVCFGAGKNEADKICAECQGARINKIGRNLRLDGKNIFELCQLVAPELKTFLEKISFNLSQNMIALPVLRELSAKIAALIDLGLDYLPLTRDCATLSTGELQRLRLSAAMGSPLAGVLYIFDEPSAGLHPNDNARVLLKLKTLKDRGNSVLMIEHDAESILAADYIVDVGPGGGSHGGEIVFAGQQSDFIKSSLSPTALAIRESTVAKFSESKNESPFPALTISSGSRNNIRALNLKLPLDKLITIAGVSGSGKSTLVHGIIFETLNGSVKADAAKEFVSEFAKINTDLEITRVLEVNQRPIGANSRSTPASYLGLWDEIRKLFANSIEAKSRGWKNAHFSYNTGKGRCAECRGKGEITLEMNFLAAAQVLCETCGGKRFNDETGSVQYLGLSISQVLKLTFEEAREVFANHRRIHQPLHAACELGLGYLTLGQSSATLSGGESQRIKLVSELGQKRQGRTVYILDEPTTGLHKTDVGKLVKTLKELVALGNTVIAIEHDADLISNSDWLVELGPGPGAEGGKVIYCGALNRQFLQSETPWARRLTT